jgi:hypothetical protein
MNDPRTQTDHEVTRPLAALRRRVKRGIVASYIHDISARHNNGEARELQRPEPAVEPARGG